MTAPHVTPNPAPLFLCRVCGVAAVRYLPGKRRSFYCADHGPQAVKDWGRLIILPTVDAHPEPVRGKALAITSPLPDRVARIVDQLVDGLRDVFQDIPAVIGAPDPEAVKLLQDELRQTRADLERTQRELKVATEIADEAMALWPADEAPTEQFPTTIGPATPELRAHADALAHAADPKPLTERDLPAPPLTPQPRHPDDAPSFPDPTPPEPVAPKKPSKGYRIIHDPVTHHEEAVPVEQPKDEPIPLTTGGTFSDQDLSLFGLQALITRIKRGPRAPALGVTRRALKDFDALSKVDKRSVLHMLMLLGSQGLDVIRVSHLKERDTPDARRYSMRASRRLRVVCAKQKDEYVIERIVDRADRDFYTWEA